jgi:D-serine deaminase-like pyridoxal phosphate-dependent protein
VLDVFSRPDLVESATARARQEYGAMIGRHRQEVVTPALLLDRAAVQRNIDKMADHTRGLGVAVRPHVKTHKSPQLSLLQVQAGAVGIATATVWEAIVMARAGVNSVSVMNTVVGEEKLEALAILARDHEVLVAIDDADNAAEIAAAGRAAGSTVGLLIEVDTGMDRAGVDSVEEAVELARAVIGLEGVRLEGVTGYEGHCSLTPERDLRHERQQTAMAFLVSAAEAIRATGAPCPVVSAGGTATWDWTAAYPGVTEVQAGSYALMDIFHGSMVPDFEIALTVLTRVCSRRPDRVITDAGNKSIGAPGLVTIKGHDLENLRFDEEHGVFIATPSSPIKLGDVLELVPGYTPATVNLFDVFHVLEDDRVIDIWPVIPRGPGYGSLIGLA